MILVMKIWIGGEGFRSSVHSGESDLDTELRAVKTTPSMGVLRPLLIIFSDVFFLAAAFLTAGYLINFWDSLHGMKAQTMASYLGLPIAFIGLSVTLLTLSRTYDSPHGKSLVRGALRIVIVVSFASLVTGLLGLFVPEGRYDTALGASMWLFSVVFLLIGEHIFHWARQALKHRGFSKQVIMVRGMKSASLEAHRAQRDSHVYPFEDSADSSNGKATDGTNGRKLGDLPALVDLAELPGILDAHNPREIILAVPADEYPQVESVINSQITSRTRPHIALGPPMNGAATEGSQAEEASGAFPWYERPFPWHYETIKRALSLLVTLLLLVIAIPLIALIAICIKLDSPGPILFRQVRVGRRGRLFEMYKFRSMRQEAETLLKDVLDSNEASGPMFKIQSDPRITRVGRIIRRLSVDELPQLFNVLQGTMTLVGPRPPLPRELEEYEAWHFQRLEAVPGLTGLWQVSRGNESSFDQMVRMDIHYIENWSLAGDIVILLKTIPAAVIGRGAF